MARHGFTRRVTIVLAGAVAVSAVAAIGQTRPLSDAEARRQAAVLTAPELVCEVRARRAVLRRPDDYRLRFEQWDGPVQAVLARVPADVRDRGLVVSMRDPQRGQQPQLLAHAPAADCCRSGSGP